VTAEFAIKDILMKMGQDKGPKPLSGWNSFQ